MDNEQGLPSAEDLDKVVGEQETAELTAPPSLPNPTSHGEAVKGAPHSPSIDSTLHDSLDTPKQDVGPLGPRGDNAPLDVLTEDEKKAVAAKIDARLAQGMSSTDAIDSIGNPKRIEGEHPQVGPRGSNTPKDSFHRGA